MAVLEGGESFLKVSRIFVILSHVFLSRQSVFIAPALSHLGLSIRMYTYLCVCFLFVFVRVAPWNVYIELFIVLRLRLCFVWVNKLWFTLDFITCSRIFPLVSRLFHLFALFLCCCFLCSIFNFDFTDYHLVLLIAYRVWKIYDDTSRSMISLVAALVVVVVVADICCLLLLLLNLCVSFLFINLIVLSLFFFRFIVLLIFYNNLQYHKRITDSEGTMRNTHKI